MMSNMMRLSHELKTGKKYDIVFMARFDLALFEKLVLPESIDKNTVYGSYNMNQIEQCNDSEVFWYCHPDVALKMSCPAIPEVEKEFIPGYGFVGEQLFTSIRLRHGFRYKNHPKIKFGLIRSWGIMEIRT